MNIPAIVFHYKPSNRIISFLLFSLFCMVYTLPLLSVFIESILVSPTLQLEQYDYHSKTLIINILLILVVGFISKHQINQSPALSCIDYLVLLFVLTILATYQWQLDPAPERLQFLCCICILWYSLRIITTLYPTIANIWQLIFMLLGAIQALLGLRQLYGFEYSNHSQYGMTGSFFNPGPYCGYLAMIFPIALYYILHFRHHKRLNRWYITTIYYFAYICCLLIFIVLPAGMSRTAWIAAIISGLWVTWMELKWSRKLRKLWKQHRKRMILSGIIISVLTLILFSIFFFLKKDSANGRLFLWKMDLYTWQSNPAGVGLGGFPAAYGKAQAAYFSKNNFTATEEHVAGTPHYAFNEYLQILVEHSIWGVLVILLIILSVYRSGLKNRQIAWLGAWISLLIFSFASYPMQLPVFVVASVYIAVGCLTPFHHRERRGAQRKMVESKKRNNFIHILIALFLIASGFYLSYSQRDMIPKYERWANSRILYSLKLYEKVAEEYAEHYEGLKHNPDFLFEYGQSLNKIEKYSESNRVLERGTLLSGDPMFWNVMGRNYQAMQQYGKAEECFQKAINVLPGRLYPYYLLTKLYAEPGYYNRKKIEEIGQIVLTKEPKVQSTAVKEMRREIKTILNEI